MGIAVAMASLVSYIAVSRQLEGQVTSNLEDAVASLPPLHLIPSSTGYGVPPAQLVAFPGADWGLPAGNRRRKDGLQAFLITSGSSL